MPRRIPPLTAARVGRDKPAWRQVYFIEAEGVDLVKIGCADDAVFRRQTLQVGSPVRLTLRGVFHTDDADHMEAHLHRQFSHLRQHGEWFRIDDDLRIVMDGLLDPECKALRMCFHPDRHAMPALVTVHAQPNDTPESFAERACIVARALGVPILAEEAA